MLCTVTLRSDGTQGVPEKVYGTVDVSDDILAVRWGGETFIRGFLYGIAATLDKHEVNTSFYIVTTFITNALNEDRAVSPVSLR